MNSNNWSKLGVERLTFWTDTHFEKKLYSKAR